jgi:drug/metabolite transporter (DMT)-like permease
MTSDNLRGALVMTGGMAAFTLSDACMKALGAHLPLFQTLLIRGVAIALLLGGAAVAFTRLRDVAVRDWGLMGLRAVCEMGAAWFYLTALTLLPIADVAAIHQAVPLAVTLAAMLVLGERAGWDRMLAILVGLGGVLLIIRPGGEVGLASLYVLGSVACVTVRDIVSRMIRPEVPTLLMAAVAAGGVMAFGAAGAAFVDWRPVGTGTALLLLGTILFTLAGYLATAGAMRVGEVAFVTPFRYTSLLVAVVLGVALFGTVPDAATLWGSVVVVAAGLVAILGERRRLRPGEEAPPVA